MRIVRSGALQNRAGWSVKVLRMLMLVIDCGLWWLAGRFGPLQGIPLICNTVHKP